MDGRDGKSCGRDGGAEGRKVESLENRGREEMKKIVVTPSGPYGGSKVAGGRMGAGGMASGATTLCGGADVAG